MAPLTSVQLGLLFFGGIAVAQSFFIAAYAGWQGRKDPRTYWLALFFAALGLRVSKSIFSHILTNFSVVGSLLGLTGLFLAGPAFYLFCRQTADQSHKRAHILHIIVPVLVVAVIAVIPVDKSVIGWLYRLGTVQFAVYVFIAANRLRKAGGLRPALIRYLFVVSLLFLTVFVVQLVAGKTLYYTIGTFVASSIFYSATFLMLVRGNGRLLDKEPASIEAGDAREIERRWRELFENKKLYRTKGLTLQQCAEELNIPVYRISKAINQRLKKTFNQLVNQYRVDEVKLILSEGTNTDKVEHLAKQAGFSGVSSLYESFKRETGMTVDEFRRKSQ